MEQKQVYIIDTCALRKPNALEILRPLVEAGHEVAVPYQVHRELLRQQESQPTLPEAERSEEPARALAAIQELQIIPWGDTGIGGPADKEIFCYCMENCSGGLGLVTQDFNLSMAVMEFCPGVQVLYVGERRLVPFMPKQYYQLAGEFREVYLTAAGMEAFSSFPLAFSLAAAVVDKGGRVLFPSHSRGLLSDGAAAFCTELEQGGLLEIMPALGPCGEKVALQARLLTGCAPHKALLLVGEGDSADEYRSLAGRRLACLKKSVFELGSVVDGKLLVPLPAETAGLAPGTPPEPEEAAAPQEEERHPAVEVPPLVEELTPVEKKVMDGLQKRHFAQATQVLNSSRPELVTVALLAAYLELLAAKQKAGEADFSTRFTGKISKKAFRAILERMGSCAGAESCLETLDGWAATPLGGDAKLAKAITAIADLLRGKMK
ncbi:MAG: hypothetical protein Q4F30_06485 [Akkermansia sp.]|nr:hypothetical protein [Akkermansia sp.]